jgi:hypothetical protein
MTKDYEELGMKKGYDPLKGKKAISYEERDKLLHFNTKDYWHTFFCPKTNTLYNEFCIKLPVKNPRKYLQERNLLSKEGDRVINWFEGE